MGWGNQIAEASSRADQAMCLAIEIRDLLQDMAEGQGNTERVQHIRRTVVIQTDGAGAGSAAIPLRAGVDLELISYAGVASATSTGVALFYMDQGMDASSFFALAQLSQFFGDSFAEGDRIPAGRDMAVAIQGGPANGTVTINLSGRVLLSEPTTDAAWSGE